MENLSPSQGNPPIRNDYSVLESYNICLIFLRHLGVLIRPYTSSLIGKIAGDYDGFFSDTSLWFENCKEWSAAVYQLKKATKENHENIKLNVRDIFLCTIELCRLYREWWKAELDYLINLLESMKKEPQKHAVEWELWRKSINDVVNKHIAIAYNFNWNGEPAR